MLKEAAKKEDVEDVDDLVDNMAVAIDDDVFLDVLREPGCNVGFVLTKSTS